MSVRCGVVCRLHVCRWLCAAVCFHSTSDSRAALSREPAWPGPFSCWLTGRHAALQWCSCMLVLQRKCAMIPQSAAPQVDPKKAVFVGVVGFVGFRLTVCFTELTPPAITPGSQIVASPPSCALLLCLWLGDKHLGIQQNNCPVFECPSP